MKIKTSELKDIALDWTVLNLTRNFEVRPESQRLSVFMFGHTRGGHRYSSNWAQGGPIIEREKINLEYPRDNCPWQANMWHEHLRDGSHFSHGSGDTALEAAMRCYLASKLGDEIEIPEELIWATKAT